MPLAIHQLCLDLMLNVEAEFEFAHDPPEKWGSNRRCTTDINFIEQLAFRVNCSIYRLKPSVLVLENF
jgi:hypothetical protein